jgi:hypothetical protein
MKLHEIAVVFGWAKAKHHPAYEEHVRYVRRVVRGLLDHWQESRMALPLPRRGEGRGEGQELPSKDPRPSSPDA